MEESPHRTAFTHLGRESARIGNTEAAIQPRHCGWRDTRGKVLWWLFIHSPGVGRPRPQPQLCARDLHEVSPIVLVALGLVLFWPLSVVCTMESMPSVLFIWSAMRRHSSLVRTKSADTVAARQSDRENGLARLVGEPCTRDVSVGCSMNRCACYVV